MSVDVEWHRGRRDAGVARDAGTDDDVIAANAVIDVVQPSVQLCRSPRNFFGVYDHDRMGPERRLGTGKMKEAHPGTHFRRPARAAAGTIVSEPREGLRQGRGV